MWLGDGGNAGLQDLKRTQVCAYARVRSARPGYYRADMTRRGRLGENAFFGEEGDGENANRQQH